MTNPICWTCKNCSYKCVADCEHCHTIQHRAVLIIFPLNLLTITITRMLSSGGEGAQKRHTNDLVNARENSSGGSRVFAARSKRLCRRPQGRFYDFITGVVEEGLWRPSLPFLPSGVRGGVLAEIKFTAFLPSKYTI